MFHGRRGGVATPLFIQMPRLVTAPFSNLLISFDFFWFLLISSLLPLGCCSVRRVARLFTVSWFSWLSMRLQFQIWRQKFIDRFHSLFARSFGNGNGSFSAKIFKYSSGILPTSLWDSFKRSVDCGVAGVAGVQNVALSCFAFEFWAFRVSLKFLLCYRLVLTKDLNSRRVNSA